MDGLTREYGPRDTMTSRKNAMLTTEDRRWLTGEKTYEGEHAKQQRYQRRRDIRERVYNSILDFTILFDHLEDEERERLFGEAAGRTDRGFEDRAFENGVRDALAFVLYSIGATALMTPRGRDTPAAALTERLLADGLYRAGRKDDVLVEGIDLDIDATHLPIADVLDALDAGEELSPAELGLLLETERVDTAEIQERIRAMLVDEPTNGTE